MKTTISNTIHFEDNLERRFLNDLKHIFPLFDLKVEVWHFEVKKLGKGQYKFVVEFNITFDSKTKKFIYSKHSTDSQIIDLLTKDTGKLKRKIIINMISNDSFIEELSELLDELEYEY